MQDTRKDRITVMGQALALPGWVDLVVVTAGLAVVLWAASLMGLVVSVPGFVFGCGVTWLVLAGLDLRRGGAWLVLASWLALVFGGSMVVIALAG